jgi:plasmid stabilization system protein ParE
MRYNIIIRPEARMELLEAFHWYQQQKPGLGYDFKLCIDELLSKLSGNPNLHPIIHRDVKRAFIKRFPFGVFYIVSDTDVIILAVLHARRDPKNWKSRV